MLAEKEVELRNTRETFEREIEQLNERLKNAETRIQDLVNRQVKP